MVATTKAQRMKAIKENAEKERARIAAETLAFDKRTAETNKRIAEMMRQKDLRDSNTTVAPFNPSFLDITAPKVDIRSSLFENRNQPALPPMNTEGKLMRDQAVTNIPQSFIPPMNTEGKLMRDQAVTNVPQVLIPPMNTDGKLMRDQAVTNVPQSFIPPMNTEGKLMRDQAVTNVPQLTSSVTPMSAAEEAVVDNDIELARIQQAMGGIDVNPEFVQRAMQNANANGDTRVTPQTLAGTSSIIERMGQWDDDVWDSFFDEELGPEAIATAKLDMTPTITPEPINTAPNVTPKAVNTVPTMEYTAPINADQRVIENLAELNGGSTPAIDPTVRVPDQIINGLAPRAPVSAPTDYPMGPTILINEGAGQEEDLTPQLVPDMPQNGGPDRGGYPNKTKLPNNPNAAPQRPGYNVVKSSDGSPVKSGNGYAWTKDYQHSIWGDK